MFESTIDGGYRLIGVRELMAVWWAYESGRLRFQDVRVFLASHEMVSRRCVIEKGRVPHYTLEELGRLVGGGSARTLRASLRRLEQAEVSTWNVDGIFFNEFASLDTEFEERLALIANRRRKVPVPRRTIRWLAGSSKPVLLATVLGHLFRCVYGRRGSIAAEGSISATWVAGVFGVDPRNVKRAKAHLRANGWLLWRKADHWHQQRNGGRVAVNLSWQEVRCTESPRRRRQSCTGLPPPDSNKKLPKESKNQKPAGRLPGVKNVVHECREPSLRDVQPADLKDTGRVLSLYRQAKERGLVKDSEYDRLQFAAGAVRASARAARNPGGFFWSLLKDRLWHHASATEEEQARVKLHRHLNGVDGRRLRERGTTDDHLRLDRDVRLVAHLTRELASRGFAGDPFVELAKQDSRWTRQRWDRAMRAWLNPQSRAG